MHIYDEEAEFTDFKQERKNEGSIVIEMCFIMPIVIVVVFLVINMMLTQINKSIALGEAYQIIYNKENYIMGGKASATAILEDSIEANISEGLNFVDEIKVDLDIEDGGGLVDLLAVTPGYLNASVSYQEMNIGIFLILDDEASAKEITAHEEIRDTAGNLRRWQLYGKIL